MKKKKKKIKKNRKKTQKNTKKTKNSIFLYILENYLEIIKLSRDLISG